MQLQGPKEESCLSEILLAYLLGAESPFIWDKIIESFGRYSKITYNYKRS